MVTFFKTLAAVAGLFLIVPLAVWAATGKPRHAWFALKRYLLIMGSISVVGVVVGVALALTN